MTQINQQQIAATDGSADLSTQLTTTNNGLAAANNGIAANTSRINNIPLKGEAATVSALPTTGNASGDLYFVVGIRQFYVWDTTGTMPQWAPTGMEQRGTAFPTANLYGGLLFYRTDLELLFIYSLAAQAWVQK